ncbi:hypothetical protein JZ751_012886 [Albula glossodonta]|uniref:Uncharacterized protein n=1 Tax=Albula glossodonta TaxID=121402 RepID=A0A8T2MYA4_9TELE|nr:hypothetical protein JZ751_012886 [Albula glossodonta]
MEGVDVSGSSKQTLIGDYGKHDSSAGQELIIHSSEQQPSIHTLQQREKEDRSSLNRDRVSSEFSFHKSPSPSLHRHCGKDGGNSSRKK